MKITLIAHPFLRWSHKTYEIDQPCSVKEFCEKFNIALRFKPRRNGVGSDKPLIRITKERGCEDSILQNNDTLTISDCWLYGCGPFPDNFDFKTWLETLVAAGKGIGGHPPYEELRTFENTKWINGDNYENR